jgi:hypothetical protein
MCSCISQTLGFKHGSIGDWCEFCLARYICLYRYKSTFDNF